MPFEWIDLNLVLIAAITALAILVAIVVMRPRNGRFSRRLVGRRLECPVERKPASVNFVVTANDGEAYLDVATCSLLPPGEPVECGKVCRSASVAPFSGSGQAGT